MFDRAKSGYKQGLRQGRKDDQQVVAESKAGIWITLIGAVVSISALEHLTRWPWYATYPLALIAGLAITAGYIKLKQFVVGNPK